MLYWYSQMHSLCTNYINYSQTWILVYLLWLWLYADRVANADFVLQCGKGHRQVWYTSCLIYALKLSNAKCAFLHLFNTYLYWALLISSIQYHQYQHSTISSIFIFMAYHFSALIYLYIHIYVYYKYVVLLAPNIAQNSNCIILNLYLFLCL